MAEEVEISNVGGDGVASEATLKSLTEYVKKLAQATGKDPRAEEAKLLETANKARKSGITTINKNTEALEDHTDAVEESESRFARLNKGIAGLVAEGIGQLLTGTYNMGKELLVGGDRLSNFSRHVPIIGGGLEVLTGIIDSQVDSFRSLTNVGMDFGGSIFEVRNQAVQAGLSLDAFQNAVTQNSQSLALFAGSAAAGGRAFARISGQVQKNLGQTFSNLGMTMEETAEFTADYLSMQTRLGRAQQMTEAQLAQRTGEYIMQLDRLAKVTGQQREEVAAQLQQESMDARMRAILSTLDETAQANLTGVTTILESASPQAAEAVREMVAMNGVPVSDFGKDLVRLNPRLADMSRGLRDGTVTQDEFMAEIRRTAEMANNLSDEQKRQYATLAGLGSSVGSAAIEFLALTNVGEGLTDAMRDQEAAADRGASGILDFERRLTQARNIIIGTLIESGVFEALETTFSDIINYFTSPQGMGQLKNAVQGIADFFTGFIEDLQNLGLGGTLKKYFKDIMEDLKTMLFGGTVDTAEQQSTIDSRRGGLQSEQNALTSQLNAGEITDDEYAERIEIINAAMADLDRQQQQLEESGGRVEGVFGSLIPDGLGDALSGLLGMFDNLGTTLAVGGALIVGVYALGAALKAVGLKGALVLAALGFAAGGLGYMFNGISNIIDSVTGGFGRMADGLEDLQELDAGKLSAVGEGISAITGPLMELAVGGILASFVSDGTFEGIAEGLSGFSRINGEHLKSVAEGISAFGGAMSDFAGGGLAAAAKNAIAGFFGGDNALPIDEIKRFGDAQINTEGVKANAEAVGAFTQAINSMSGSTVGAGLADVASNAIDAVLGWFGGEKSLPLDDVAEFGNASINAQGVVANANAIAVFVDAINSMSAISAGGDLNLGGYTQAADELLEFANSGTRLSRALASIDSNATNLQEIGNHLSTIASIEGLEEKFNILNLSLDSDKVSTYTDAIEALVEKLEELNDVLKDDNSGYFGIGGGGPNAGEVLSNINVNTGTSSEGLGRLNSTMQEILEVLQDQLETQENTERRIRGLNGNIVTGGAASR